MILLILRLLIAGLLALTGVTTEDVILSHEGVITDECTEGTECSTPPSELPGPSPTG